MTIGLDDVDDLTAADIAHSRLSSLPVSATVGDVRAYFAGSSSRQLALLVDGDRYAGALAPADIPESAESSAMAVDFAHDDPAVLPSAPAHEARDAALGRPSARLPVVDEHGALVGVVAINDARDGFCGT